MGMSVGFGIGIRLRLALALSLECLIVFVLFGDSELVSAPLAENRQAQQKSLGQRLYDGADVCDCEDEEQGKNGSGKEEVGKLGECPVVQEADIPVFALNVRVDGWDGVVAPRWRRRRWR